MRLWVLVDEVAAAYKVVGFEVAPVGITTTITISAPPIVAPNDPFFITGILYETTSLIPIPNQTITISYNGTILGSAITGIDGDYLIQASIPTLGFYTLTATFQSQT